MTTGLNQLLALFVRFIRLYQHTLSPDHGVFKNIFPHGVCRFTPSCSEYAAQALSHHGLSGLSLALRRVLRCHPFAIGGNDPVPPTKQ